VDYEKLGAFYLGRRYDLERGEILPDPILYDAKDLTTHAMCVGMTGSGKTGLGVTLLEEAVIDGIPIVAIDPKGDLGNLLLTFPSLDPAAFEPWIDANDAARQGRSVAEQAEAVAQLWRRGLADWDQEPTRIARYAEAAQRRVLTPGSDAGIPLNVLGSLSAPPDAVRGDIEALRERILGATAGLLGLLGIRADPLQSREHILLASLLERAWREGRDLDLPTLIQQIQRPPLERIGVLDIESFFPASDRARFALSVNNLLASPGFELWRSGEPLDASRLLFSPDGQPRLSIVSIAHLSDPERMFVVTQVLNELVSWMRTRPGSSTLRALLYMDEVFGYLPPTANPPSKAPMLTLLKQARAFGLGIVLATQNPVDLDYKALSNAGTWFLGRLQTERDKARVLDGLEGAAVGATFDRRRADAILSGLKNRVFLMNNVHEDEPVVYHTRWALSYLAGPLTREQIRVLMASPPRPARAAESPATESLPRKSQHTAPRPALPATIEERFLPITQHPAASEQLHYRPALLAQAHLHYVHRGAGLDRWEQSAWLAPLDGEPWDNARRIGAALPELDDAPEPGAAFAELPAAARRASRYKHWQRTLRSYLFEHAPLELYRVQPLKLYSTPEESEAEFRGRVRQIARERRDRNIEKLRRRYASRLGQLKRRIQAAEQRLEREQAQYRERKLSTAVSLGATVLGALFGRKVASVGNVGRASTAVRGMGRVAKEHGDIAHAEENLELAQRELAELEAQFEDDVALLEAGFDDIEIEIMQLAPRKADREVGVPALVWCPWRIGANGHSEPAWAADPSA
jgi:hypothetical protein